MFDVLNENISSITDIPLPATLRFRLLTALFESHSPYLFFFSLVFSSFSLFRLFGSRLDRMTEFESSRCLISTALRVWRWVFDEACLVEEADG
jgi:hypothetical protein